jgi:hypothetical protein
MTKKYAIVSMMVAETFDVTWEWTYEDKNSQSYADRGGRDEDGPLGPGATCTLGAGACPDDINVPVASPEQSLVGFRNVLPEKHKDEGRDRRCELECD